MEKEICQHQQIKEQFQCLLANEKKTLFACLFKSF